MKLLTSLGTGKYEEAEYVWGDRRHRTRFFPEALVEWLNPETTVVFLTEGSKQHENWQELKPKLDNRTCVREIDIPNGHSEPELWEIFDQIVQSVDEGEAVVVDITHAFRSLPLVVFVVAAYLRAVKNVTVKHVLYGCYISRDKPASVLDLTLMVDLLDWMEGVRRFKELGDARWLGKTLEETQDELYRTNAFAKPNYLKSAGKRLKHLSEELHTVRVIGAMQTALQLSRDLRSARQEIAEWAKPFFPLVDDTLKVVEQFAHGKPEELNAETLNRQRELIQQLRKFGMVLQAVELAREWVISWVLWRYIERSEETGLQWLKGDTRERVGTEMSQEERKRKEPSESSVPLKYMNLLSEEERRRVAEVWRQLGDLRNDLAHCGMRENPRGVGKLHEQARDLLKELNQFAIED